MLGLPEVTIGNKRDESSRELSFYRYCFASGNSLHHHLNTEANFLSGAVTFHERL